MQESLVSRMTEHDADRDVSVVKIFSVIGVTSFTALISGFFLLQSQLWYTGIFLVLFWVMFTLQAIFIKSWKTILIALGIESFLMALPVAIVSNNYFSPYMLAALLILFLSLLMAEVAARDTIKNALHMPFWRVVREVMLKAVTGVLLFTALIYIFLAGGSNISPVKNFRDTFVAASVKTLDPSLSESSSTREVLRQVALKSLSGENLERFNKLSTSEKAAELNEATAKLFESVGGYFELTNINAPISQSVDDAMQNKFYSLSSLGRLYMILAIGALIWFAIRSIAFILYFPLVFIVFIVYETLIALGFAVVQYESRSREIVILN